MGKLDEILLSLKEFEKKAENVPKISDIKEAVAEIENPGNLEEAIEKLIKIRNYSINILVKISKLRNRAIEERIKLEKKTRASDLVK